MLKLRVHRTIASVKNVWKELEKTGGDMCSVYQSYWVNSVVKRRMLIYNIQRKCSVRYLQLIEDGKTRMILPVCKTCGSNRYHSVGQFNGYQVFDFVYSKEMTPEKMEQYLSFVLRSLKIEHLSLRNVPRESVLLDCMTGQKNWLEDYEVAVQSSDNVCIDSKLDYDLWYGNLSKSMRQNVRTAYNRMNTDNVSMDFEISRGGRVRTAVLNEIIGLYCKRHATRYNVETSPLKKLYLRYLDFSTACMRYYHDRFYAVVYMNGKLAAFMSGLVEKGGSSIIIPRLSIEDAFSKYSPGVVLINETIRKMASDLGIRYLDLSKGTEQYKLSMGGHLYQTYHIDLIRKRR